HVAAPDFLGPGGQHAILGQVAHAAARRYMVFWPALRAAAAALSSASCCLAVTSPDCCRSALSRSSRSVDLSSVDRLSSAMVLLMCSRTFSSALTSASP